jgi:hypothetical protein
MTGILATLARILLVYSTTFVGRVGKISNISERARPIFEGPVDVDEIQQVRADVVGTFEGSIRFLMDQHGVTGFPISNHQINRFAQESRQQAEREQKDGEFIIGLSLVVISILLAVLSLTVDLQKFRLISLNGQTVTAAFVAIIVSIMVGLFTIVLLFTVILRVAAIDLLAYDEQEIIYQTREELVGIAAWNQFIRENLGSAVFITLSLILFRRHNEQVYKLQIEAFEFGLQNPEASRIEALDQLGPDLWKAHFSEGRK